MEAVVVEGADEDIQGECFDNALTLANVLVHCVGVPTKPIADVGNTDISVVKSHTCKDTNGVAG